MKKEFQTHGICILCLNSQNTRFNDLAPFKLELQLLQDITHIYLAYSLPGCFVSPEIQNR